VILLPITAATSSEQKLIVSPELIIVADNASIFSQKTGQIAIPDAILQRNG